MRVLYGIQGTGYGHISRAAELLPILQNKCELDILISGYHSSNPLPFPVNYSFNGISFYPSENGGIDLIKTAKSIKLKTLFQDILTLKANDYDLIITDFEPVSAYAAILSGTPIVELSHQASVLKSSCPKPKGFNGFQRLILKLMCPVKTKIGFHFTSVDNLTFTPVIRKSIRENRITDEGFVLVYLPAYHHDLLVKHFEQESTKRFVIYSNYTKENIKLNNSIVKPISQKAFTDDLLQCQAVICGAGFETPAEALYLGKKLIVIPMKSQFEQQCNALFLEGIGVRIESNPFQIRSIDLWLQNAPTIRFDYPDISSHILDSVLKYANTADNEHSISLLTSELYLRDF